MRRLLILMVLLLFGCKENIETKIFSESAIRARVKQFKNDKEIQILAEMQTFRRNHEKRNEQ